MADGEAQDVQPQSEADELQALWDAAEAAERSKDAQQPETAAEPEEPQPVEEPEQPAETEAQQPEAAAPEPEQPKQPAPEDIWSTAPEPLRQAWEAVQKEVTELRQFKSSNAGRQRALQEQINKLRTAQPQPAKPAPDILQSDQWKQLATEYPGLFEPLGAAITALTERAAGLERELSTLRQESDLRYVATEADLLAQAHPDWQDVAASPDFQNWIGTQPRYVQEAVVRNASGIVDAGEAADIISRFKASRPAPAAGGQPQPPAAPAATNTPQPTLSVHRQRQLNSATTPRGRAPAAMTTGIPDDPDAAWEYWRRYDEQRGRA